MIPMPPAPLPTVTAESLVSRIRRVLGDVQVLPAAAARERLRTVLTRTAWDAIPAEAWPLLDALWAAESAGRTATRAADLARLGEAGWASRVSLWHGDITALEVDAVVNAANSGLTGCYQPRHGCVDNAIHTAAGPRLREECGRIMVARGRPEPCGTATVTRGYFLPARHVVHTVGPALAGRDPTAGDAELLWRCYASCLAAAAGLGTRVAFCGISTGVFGYPVASAAPAALAAVRSYLQDHAAPHHVVLVTFTEHERATYAVAAEEACHA